MPDAALRLIEAGPGHAGVLAALHGECLPERWGLHAYQKTLATPGTAALLALGESDEPAGFALFRTAGSEAEILTIGVRPARRRQGIARLLLARVAIMAATAGSDRLFLEVAADNAAAQALYHAAGFRAVGRRENYYRRSQGAAIDALILQLDL
jgi:ribosomal-protein-alanine N-acetyltransferase